MLRISLTRASSTGGAESSMHKIRSLREIDRPTQRQHRLWSGSVAATSTPSFDARGVWFNFRVLRAHEPGAVREQSDAKRVSTFIVASVSIGDRAEWPLGLTAPRDRPPCSPHQRRVLSGHFVDLAHGLVEFLDPRHCYLPGVSTLDMMAAARLIECIIRSVAGDACWPVRRLR